MRKSCQLIFTIASLLTFAWAVKAAPVEAAVTSGYRQYFLDQGFMGHDFALDVDDLGLKISFTSTTIPWPGVLHVITQPTEATTSALGYPRFGPDFQLAWTTNAPESPDQLMVKLKDPTCGQTAWHGCALEQTFQGKTELLRPIKPVAQEAEAMVKLGATVRLVEIEGYMSEGYASWYAYKSCPCAASPDFPKGSLVRVTNLDAPEKKLVVKINDFGPERDLFPERAIDLDKVAFAKLASLGAGVIRVKVEPLAPDDPAVLAYTQSTQAVISVKTVSAVSANNEWQL